MNRSSNSAKHKPIKRKHADAEKPLKKLPNKHVRAEKVLLGRWFSDHLDSGVDSLTRLLRSPFQSLMTILVIAVALCLPSVLYVAVKSVDTGISHIQKTADISVYFKVGTEDQLSQNIQADILAMNAVEAVRFLTSDQALEEFQSYSGLGDALLYLEENPLPPTLLVTPKVDSDQIELLLESIRQFDSVDQVEFDYLWLKRLESLISILERAVVVLTALLSLGVILILGNTIRLEIENRREEIVVVKLVGGTNAFVRRPLLYSGIWYGALGALLAWFLTNLFSLLLSGPLSKLGELYFRDLSLTGLNSIDLLGLVFIGLLLGLLGAWLSAARHLAEIEPR